MLQTQTKDNPVFFHVDFMKPGKNTYIVEHAPKQDTDMAFLEMTAFDDDVIAGTASSKE